MNRHHSAADNQRSSSLSESLGRTVPATRVTPRPSLEQLKLRGSKKHPIYILEDDEDAHKPTSSFKKRITSPSASLDVQNSSQELHRQSDSKVEQTDGTAVVPAANNSPLPPPVTSQGILHSGRSAQSVSKKAYVIGSAGVGVSGGAARRAVQWTHLRHAYIVVKISMESAGDYDLLHVGRVFEVMRMKLCLNLEVE
ncbi:hypothetical protein Vi05172_g11795 [Venturia inaequalis]|nr:hypothetical protein Vi05172_g11795 [Venturia inaequalis]